MPLLLRYQLIDRPAWPPPMTATEWCATGMGWGAFMGRLRSFVETVDGDPRVGNIRESAGRRLDASELRQRAAAGHAVFGLHPLARDAERGAAAFQEIRQRIIRTDRKIVLDHQRGRVTALALAIGPADVKAHFRHRRPRAALRRLGDGRGPPWPSHAAPRPQSRAS